MKILFLSDNFPPEVNAPANRTHEHCREWVKLGAEVTVITTQPNFPQGRVYEGYKNQLYQVEEIDGIRVVRVWSFITSNSGFLLRILDYISYAFAAVIASLFEKRPDVIIATSPQFFTACAGYLVSLLKRRPWIFEVRDLWPESIKAVGAMNDSLVIRLLEKLELFLYRKATKIISVTDSFKERIAARGIAADKIAVVKNGVDLDKFDPSDIDPELREKLGLEAKFVVGYIGTHGMAHGLDFIIRAAKEFEQEEALSNVHFLLVGDGAQRESLLQLKEELSPSNVTMLPAVAKQEAVHLLNMIDVALVNLRKSDTFLTVLPSKIFEAAALKKPIVLGVEGEAKALVSEYGAGVCFEPEGVDCLKVALSKLATDSPSYQECQNGCDALAKDFSRPVKAERMYQELTSITA